MARTLRWIRYVRVHPIILGLVALTGCLGSVDGTAGPGAGPGGIEGSPIPGLDGEYAPLVPAPPRMVRLTQAQYRNAVEDVFGAGARPEAPLPNDDGAEAFSSIGASLATTTVGAVERYRDAALEVARWAVVNRETIPALAGCVPGSATDPCIEQAVRDLGRRLWRRSLSDEEVAPIVAVVGAAGEGAEDLALGLEYALAVLLQSPNFLYVPYVGEQDPATGVRRYTSIEMASRLALFFWNSIPDRELLEAADADALTDPDDIADQVARMLEAPRAEGFGARFFDEAWHVANLRADSKNSEIFPEWTPEVAAAARSEYELLLEQFTAPGQRFFDIFSTGQGYANAALAPLYETQAPGADLSPIDWGTKRKGILTSVALLAANAKAHRTSPTQRGMFVRADLLCLSVPPPPEGVVAELMEEEMANTENLSVRDKLALHQTDPTCASCHALFDPMGLALENFDAIGRFREKDQGMTIDASATFEDVPLDGAVDVAKLIESDPRTRACLAKRLYAYASGHMPTEGEAGVVEALGDYLVQEGEVFMALAKGIAVSTGFRFMAEAK
ncbi:MAG: DUF1588 domain-containing protein [Myxococcales bacterium]|nr:DUF1588 domain-containing protein [Myxococcales bacterium]